MWSRIIAASVVAAICISGAGAEDSGRQYFGTTIASGGAPLPFSEAVLVGDTLYVAGHIGLDPKTQKAADKIDTEARAVMDAVKQTLESAGLQMDDLISVTVYCTDLALYDQFNTVYRSYFHGHFPARAFIGVNSLVRGAHFEVAGIAARSRTPKG